MKIKIRPDDVSPPGGNEWAEMNGWLAELRDDSPEAPVDGSRTGPADTGQEGPADGSRTGPADTGQEGPVDGSRRSPADTGQEGPVDGSRRSPADGSQEGRAGYGPARPAPAPTSWAPGRYRASARSGVSGNSGPAGRTRTARTGAPAGTPVRAVIGDELRTPIMWCEMGSCISWHADRTALGEADVRARAIRAGWRIDALGRLTCPQCQQTKAAFRATRPVVLWDRSMAIAMAARATAPDRWTARANAGPGSRPAGPVTGPYGRDPRHPAAGPR